MFAWNAEGAFRRWMHSTLSANIFKRRKTLAHSSHDSITRAKAHAATRAQAEKGSAWSARVYANAFIARALHWENEKLNSLAPSIISLSAVCQKQRTRRHSRHEWAPLDERGESAMRERDAARQLLSHLNADSFPEDNGERRAWAARCAHLVTPTHKSLTFNLQLKRLKWLKFDLIYLCYWTLFVYTFC